MLVAPEGETNNENGYRGSDNFSPIAGRTGAQQNSVVLAPL